MEGILFVGNVKLPSFFMPRGDTLSTRLWPKYYEDLDMTATRDWAPGSTLSFAPKEFKVPEHDFDQLAHTVPGSPALWAAFLPVGYQEDAKNTYKNWAEQLSPFFKKTAAFYSGATTYGRGLYLISNDLSLLVRAKPVWDALGPKQIEFYSINEKGKDAYKKIRPAINASPWKNIRPWRRSPPTPASCLGWTKAGNRPTSSSAT